MRSRKWRFVSGVLGAVLALAVFGAVPAWANGSYDDTYVDDDAGYVDDDGNECFATIQAAINNTNPGGTVHVAAGTYDEQVVIDKALTLQGAGDTTIIKPSQATADDFTLFTRYGGGSTAGIIVANANGASVTVKNLKVDGELITTQTGNLTGATGLHGVFYRETGGAIDNVTVEDIGIMNGNGIYACAESNSVTVEVKSCRSYDYQKNGITANGPTLTVNIYDNTVTGMGQTDTIAQNGIQIGWGATGTITGNTVSDHFYTPATYHATGILLYSAKSTTVSGNTLTNNQEGVALDYATAGSGSGVTVDVNGGTITGGTYGIKIAGDSTLGSDLTCNVGNITVDAASWIGIYINGNVNLALSNNTIKNTGSGGYGIYVAYDQCSVTIDNNTIQSNGAYGIMSYGLAAATPNILTITGNTITGSSIGIYSYLSTTTANFNSIYNNTDYGVVNWDATVLDATHNWWGDVSGPTHAENPGGTGDAVSDNVDYTPWLGEQYAPTKTTGTATGTGNADFTPDAGALEGLTPVDEATLPPAGKPDLVFPHGFFSFKITGLTNGQAVVVTITLPSAVPVGTQYWKYGPTPTDPADHWYQLPMGDDDGDNVITITLVDGGLGDDDLTANGTIIDQGGPGQPPPPPPLRPVGGIIVPVSKVELLAPWMGLAALIVAAVAAVVVVRRRRGA